MLGYIQILGFGRNRIAFFTFGRIKKKRTKACLLVSVRSAYMRVKLLLKYAIILYSTLVGFSASLNHYTSNSNNAQCLSS